MVSRQPPSDSDPAPGRRTLDPSELGTKEYWDAVYDRELHNHAEDGDDEGTVWFDESGAEGAVLAELRCLTEQGLLMRGEDEDAVSEQEGSRFLDLGTGNGHMLFTLHEEDEEGERWCGEMVGVDYSEASVQLARRIAAQRHARDAGSAHGIRFEQWDLLSEPPGAWLADGFNVVLDKGTFDAISLMQHNPDSPHPCETYRQKVIPLVKSGMFLFVTSCNWTKEELVEWLAPDNGPLQVYGEARYPSFIFGGRKGQSIVTVIFRKSAR